MRELCEGLIKALMLLSVTMIVGFGFGIGIVAAFKVGSPLHIEQTTTVRNVK